MSKYKQRNEIAISKAKELAKRYDNPGVTHVLHEVVLALVGFNDREVPDSLVISNQNRHLLNHFEPVAQKDADAIIAALAEASAPDGRCLHCATERYEGRVIHGTDCAIVRARQYLRNKKGRDPAYYRMRRAKVGD